MNAPTHRSLAAKQTRQGSSAKTPAAKTWLGLAAAGLVIVAVGAMGVVGWRLASSPARGESGRSGPAVLKTATAGPAREAPGIHEIQHSTPAGPVIGQQGTAPAEHPTLDVLKQRLATASTPGAKRAAADALIGLNTEEALSAWGQTLLKETDPAVRQAMMEALDTLNGEAAVEMVTQLVELSDAPEIFDGVARTLSRMANPETIKYLAEIHAAAAPGDARQERVLRLLGAIANPAAVPGLIQVAHQPELGADLTGQAFTSLGKIGNSAALIALVGAFDSLGDHFVQRHQVLDAISAITNPALRSQLTDLAAHSAQPLVASAAADALKNLPAQAADAAETAVEAEPPAASELLAKMPPQE